MKLIEEIEECVMHYKDNYRNMPLNELHAFQDKLSALAWELGELLSEMKFEYNNAYFIRKIQTSKKVNELTNKGLAVNKAQSEALERNEEIFQDEIEKEALAYRLDINLKQTNRILESVKQRITTLRKEELN